MKIVVKYVGDLVEGSVLVFDVFFLFDDCVKYVGEYGVKVIV